MSDDKPLPTPTDQGELSGRIGKYEIVRRVGKGAMGAVYQAHDPFLDRDVALKVMLPQVAEDPEQKHRFEREAKAIARMMHPNVVMVFDLGYHTDGSPYIAMELLKGRDLFQIMRDGPELSFKQKIDVVLQALEGLGHAHKVGIVHRDIKPANIFLTEDGTVKIMDFGVARLTTASATSSGMVVGTAYYMSPEQVRGQLADGRSDLFSTGVVLYEMLTGQRLFQAESVLSTLYKILNEEPKFELAADADSQSTLPVLTKALARGLDGRYQDAAEFGAALRALPVFSTAPAVVPLPEAPTIVPGAAPVLPEAPAVAAPAPTPPPAPKPPMPPAVDRTADPTALLALMREIYIGGKTGQLHFVYGREGKELRSLRVLRGHIMLGSSDVQGERLGDVLVRYGVITQDDLDRATAVVLGQRKRLGNVLSELGILDRARLEDHVGLHVREILSNVVGRADGTYVFEEMSPESLGNEDLASKIPPGQMILEITRRIQDPVLVDKTLGDRERILTLSTNPMLRFQKLSLTPTDGFVLSRIDGTLTAHEILQLIPLPAEDTERSLFGLLLTGMIEYMPRMASDRVPSPAVRYVSPPPAPAARGSQAEPRRPAATRPSSSPPDIPVAEAPTVVRPSGSQATAGRPAPSKPAAPRAVSEDETKKIEERRRAIEDAYDGLKTRDFYALLGVDRGAGDSEVKEAYFKLARTFHPDAPLDPALDALKDKRSSVFVKLGEAFDALKTAAGRARYDERHPAKRLSEAPSLNLGPPSAPAFDPVAREREAAERIAEGERYASEGRYAEAVFPLEAAIPLVRGVLKHRGLVALSRAYMHSPGGAKRAEKTLQSVIEESPDHTDAYMALGSLYKLMGLKSRAAAMFKRALELEPDLRAARAEIDALEPPPPPPAAPAPPPDKGSIFKKIFKK